MLLDYTHLPRSWIKEESDPLIPLQEDAIVKIPVLSMAAKFDGKTNRGKKWYADYQYRNVYPGPILGNVLASVRRLLDGYAFVALETERRPFLHVVAESFDEEAYRRCLQCLSAYQYAFLRIGSSEGWNTLKPEINAGVMSTLNYAVVAVNGLISNEQALLKWLRDSVLCRYMLSTAAAIHSGMRPAVNAGYAADYSLSEIRAALMLCSGPMHSDWRTAPLETLVYDYAYSVLDENRVVRRRMYREFEYMESIPLCARKNMIDAYAIFRSIVKTDFPSIPSRSTVLFWNSRTSTPMALHITNIPYAIGVLATMVYPQARAFVALEERTADVVVEEPVYHLLFDKDIVLPDVQMPTEFFNKAISEAVAFPESVRAFRIGNANPRYVPYFIGLDPRDMQRYLLIPSTKKAAALLMRVYGIHEGSSLAPPPPDMLGFLDFHTESFGFDVEIYLPSSVYRGLIDFRAFCTGEDPRDESECDLEELFHRILL